MENQHKVGFCFGLAGTPHCCTERNHVEPREWQCKQKWSNVIYQNTTIPTYI